DKIDAEEQRCMYEKVGIVKWVYMLQGILVKYLGMPKADLPFPYPEKLEVHWMMEEVWHSGNFDIYDKQILSKNKSFVSAYPGGAQRLLRSIYLYFKYAPQEVIFFPLRRAAARLTSYLSYRNA